MIFVAKGDVFGQFLTVVFGLLYAAVSYKFGYYGEMITYLCMTAPIAVVSIITWLKHPFKVGKAGVKVSFLSKRQSVFMVVSTTAATVIFYFVLATFGTTNLTISTISITTSFLASYLMLFRSPTYALAFAANDIVLITMWILAALDDVSYLPMVICFFIFLMNDAYGFYNWKRMEKRQMTNSY